MSLHRNRVQMTVTGTPGTGTITLNAATSGYQSFASAYGADATVDILITEGNNWEVCRNCAYTNGTPQVDRGTLEGSSAGPTTRVSFGSGAIVSVIATAATGNNWGLNEISAIPTTAGVTGVVGTMHILDISGLTASRDFTLPATCAVGDRVGVFIRTGDDAFELSLKPATGDTINGGSPGAEWSRLFITGECVIFRCITANNDWIVEYDGRIPQFGYIELQQSQTITSDNTDVLVNMNTLIKATGCKTDVSSGRTVTVRRPNNYALTARTNLSSLSVPGGIVTTFYLNGSVFQRGGRNVSATGITTLYSNAVWSGELAANDAVSVYVRKNDATNRDVFGSTTNKEINAFLQVAEVL